MTNSYWPGWSQESKEWTHVKHFYDTEGGGDFNIINIKFAEISNIG